MDIIYGNLWSLVILTIPIFQAIDSWEEATDLVVQREALINKLENFERLASDPNRFFEKGNTLGHRYFYFILLLLFFFYIYFMPIILVFFSLCILLIYCVLHFLVLCTITGRQRKIARANHANWPTLYKYVPINK